MSSKASTILTSSSSGVSSLVTDKCTYCQNALGNTSIKCSECYDFYLCLKCFSMSAELGEHKKDHNYFVMSSPYFPIFDNEKIWSYKEELYLLQYIEQYGFGNWDEIAKHISGKTPEDCMKHYHSYYIYGNLGKNTFVKNSHLLSNLNQSSKDHNHQQLTDLQFKNKINQNSNSPSKPTTSEIAATTVLLPPIDMSIEEQRALGYMPLRDDFEREYKNDSEVLLSNLTIANNQLIFLNNKLDINTYLSNQNINNNNYNNQGDINEDLIDFEFKLTLIQMYRERLMEREKLKKIARDYGLTNNASALINNHYRNLNLNNPNLISTNSTNLNSSINGTNGNINFSNGLLLNGCNLNGSLYLNGLNNGNGDGRRGRRKLTIDNDKEMTELNERLKKYAQFLNVTNYENLLENLRKQRHFFKRIQELQYYRSELGLTKIKEIEKYNKEKEKLDEEKRLARKEKKAKKLSRHLETPKRVTRGQQYQIDQQKKYEMMKRKKKLAEKQQDQVFNSTPSKTKKKIKSEANDELNSSNDCSETNVIRSSRSNSTNSLDIIPRKKGRRRKNRVIESDEEVEKQIKDQETDDEEENTADSSDDGYLYDLNDENEEEYESDEESVETQNSEYSDLNNSNSNSELEDATDQEMEEDESMEAEDDDSTNEEEDEVDEEEQEEQEEDLSSAGAASSGGSGINEIKSPSKRLLIRSDSNISNNSRRLKKSLSSNENETSKRARITYMLNERSFKSNGKKNILNNSNSSNINQNHHELNGSNKSSKSKVIKSSKKLDSKSKVKNGIISKKKNKTNRRSERLCSMPGYNLLSDNEKKVKGFIF